MYRYRIDIDSNSDAQFILRELRSRCSAAGLSEREIESLVEEATGPLSTLIQSGKAVAASNGQFRASRTIVTDAATVTFDARFGVPIGILNRLRRAFGSKRH